MDLDNAATEQYDLLLLTDATASMSHFIRGLNKSLQEIIDLSALTACFQRIGVACYRDYKDEAVTEWSGWCSPSGVISDDGMKSQQDIIDMASRIVAVGGNDYPEAAKSGLALAYSKMREDATTIILMYADAPPHFSGTGRSNREDEIRALRKEGGIFSEFDECFVDWATAARTLRHGQRRAIVFPIVASKDGYIGSFHYLAHITGGNCLDIGNVTSETISTITVGLLLTWMREAAGEIDSGKLGYIPKYREDGNIQDPTEEDDFLLREYFPRTLDITATQVVMRNVSRSPFTLHSLQTLLTARGPRMLSLSIKYKSDVAYKELATGILQNLIASNVTIISLNPIFGALWRAVCNDRSNTARDKLVEAFGYQVGLISEETERKRLKQWLEDSYDHAGEIDELIQAVEPLDIFPRFS